MADLEFVDQHNMVACLEKTTGNSEFHEIVDFLTSSLIHHALTVSPTIYISYIEQFWNTASSQTVNDEKQIHATIDSKAVVVTEASIRSSLLLNDTDGTACLTNEAIFQNLALMGYEGELNKLTFQKAIFSPHCLSLKSTSWNEFSTNIASAVICLATNQKFNFSKLIFDGMLRNLDNPKKKFLMYPRFLMVFLNNQIELGEPFNDVYVTPAHTLQVFSNMSRKGLKFLGKVTPLFPNMLTQAVVDEGEGDQPSETSSSSIHNTTQDSRDSLEGTNGSVVDQVRSVSRFIYCNEEKVGKESVSKQGRKNAKPEPTLDAFDDLDADGRDYMETEDVVKERRQSNKMGELNKGSGDKGGKDSVVEPRTPPTTTSIFDDEDITMAQTLIKMKEEKDKEKGVSIKDIEDSSRLERSILTLKPLPTIDPKDEGKSVLEELEPTKKMTRKRERQREEEACKATIAETYDEVQAMIDADALFAAKIQKEEREEYTIKERAKHGAECIYYRIFRSDGSSRWIKTFSEMVIRFDRIDLVELYNLVMKRFETTALEGVDLFL
ncbi:hypothetical protein Tco_0188885 [Tanacetum coccineum]